MFKSLWTSKTFWFNVLAAIVALATVFGYKGELPAEWETYVTMAVVIINIVLRFITKDPVTVNMSKVGQPR